MESEILKRCGTRTDRPKDAGEWLSAKLRFLGAEHYVLGTKRVDVKLYMRKGGLTFEVKHKLMLRSDSLLGTKCEEAPLVDVELVVGGITLSLAALGDKLPLTLRRDEVVELL